MTQQIDLPEDDTQEDLGDFGDNAPSMKPPFWKRELLFGYSLPWILGAAVIAAAAMVYFLVPSFMNSTPSAGSFSEVESTLEEVGKDSSNGFSAPHAMTTPTANTTVPAPTVTPAPGRDTAADTMTLMTDIRDELNARDKTLDGTLHALKESVSQLSDAIKRDEAYAVETRNQLTDLNRRLALLESRQTGDTVARPAAHTSSATKRQAASPLSGMKLMSLQRGNAWIKWQGSTWSVREGETLGKVTIRRIDPDSRTVVTSAGSLR